MHTHPPQSSLSPSIITVLTVLLPRKRKRGHPAVRITKRVTVMRPGDPMLGETLWGKRLELRVPYYQGWGGGGGRKRSAYKTQRPSSSGTPLAHTHFTFNRKL